MKTRFIALYTLRRKNTIGNQCCVILMFNRATNSSFFRSLLLVKFWNFRLSIELHDCFLVNGCGQQRSSFYAPEPTIYWRLSLAVLGVCFLESGINLKRQKKRTENVSG